MTTTDDARLLEIEKRFGGAIAFMGSIATIQGDVRYLLDRLKAAESRIRELEGAMGLVENVHLNLARLPRGLRVAQYEHTIDTSARLLEAAHNALQSDEVQEEGNGG